MQVGRGVNGITSIEFTICVTHGWLLADGALVLCVRSEVFVLVVNFLVHAECQFFLDCSQIITRLHILLGEGILLQIETKSFGESHRIDHWKSVVLSLRITLGRCCLVFEHELDEFVILVEEDVERMLFMMFLVRFNILNDFYFRGSLSPLLYWRHIFIKFESSVILLQGPLESWAGGNLAGSLCFDHSLVS